MGGRTTTRHKADNTFKFDTFADKLSKISVSIWADFRGDLSRGTLGTDDNTPNLLKCVEKWSDLDLSGDFLELIDTIGTQIQTLAQIVHDARRLTDSIYEHIAVAKKDSLPATFELATALSTDLGHDFQSDRYRFMKRTIKVVSELNDANTVEHAFKCLAYLLKHGLNDVHKNFEKYFSLVKPLLESSSVRLQALACQTFARITSQRWKKVKTEKFYEEILNLISKHGLNLEGIATLFYCIMRGPWGQLTLDAELLLPGALHACFWDHPHHALWKEIILHLLDKLFNDSVLQGQGFCRQLAAQIVDLGGDALIMASSHLEFYFELVSKAHFGSLDSKSDSENILKRISSLQPLTDTFCDRTNHLLCNITISLSEDNIQPPLSTSNLLKIAITFLRAPNVSVPLKRRVLDTLSARPEVLNMIILGCGECLPPDLSPLNLVSDLMIRSRKLPHQPITGRPCYLEGGICTAVDAIKGSKRIPHTIPEGLFNCEFEVTKKWFVPVEMAMNLDIFVKEILCSNGMSHTVLLPNMFAPCETLESEYMVHGGPYFQLLLVFADVAHNGLQNGFPVSIPHSIVAVVNNLVAVLESSTIQEDARELWTLKILDFLLGCGQFTPSQMEALNLELSMDVINSVLGKYLRCGYVVFRATSLSIFYHLAIAKKNPGLVAVFEKCLEMELWNIEASAQSEVNKTMEDLTLISRRGEREINRLLMQYGLGLLFSKYAPVRKQCKALIQSCWEATNEHDCIILETLKDHEKGVSTVCPKSLRRINPSGETAFEKYEVALFDIPSVGYTRGSGFTELNWNEQWSLLWDIVATFKDITNASRDFKTDSILIATRLIKQYIKTPPYFGFKFLKKGEPPKFLSSIITWLGRCSRFDSTPMSPDYESFLQHYLMSADPTYRKAGIGAVYNMNRPLEKYRDDIETSMESGIVCLTGFSINAADPIIKDANERSLVMKFLLPLVAQKFGESLCSKRKFASKSRKPILIGLMGFAEEEVKTLISFVMGACEVDGFKKLDQWNLNRRLKMIDLMLGTWRHTFPRLNAVLLELTVKIVRAVDSDGEDIPTTEVEKLEESHELDESMAEAEGELVEFTKHKDPLSQKRQIFSTAFRILEFVYENFPDIASSSSVTLLEFIVAPRIKKLVENSTGSVSAQLKFLELWSRNPRYRDLLVKFLPMSCLTPMDYMYQVLTSEITSVTVKQYVFGIFLHLLAEPEEVLIGSMDHSCYKKFEGPPLSLEKNILLYGKHTFLSIDKHIPYSKLVGRDAPRSMCTGLFQLFRIILMHSKIEEIGQIAINLLSNNDLFLAATRHRARVDYFSVVGEIINMCPDNDGVIIHLSKNFRRKLNRLERSALISMLHGYPDEECKNALVELFAEDPNDLGSPDYERRSRGWSRLKELFTGESASFHLTRFCLIGNVLLGILKHDDQGMQSLNALDIFTHMSKIIKETSPEPELVKTFFNGVFMNTTLANVIGKAVSPGAFGNHLKLLRIFALDCGSYNHILNALTPLLDPRDDELDVICGLIDIQVNNRTKAMNRLLRLLELQVTEEEGKKPFPCFGAKLLLDYLVPLATYFIKSEKTGGKSQTVLDNLVDSSIKIYRVAAQLLTPKQYIKFLDQVLSSPPEDSGLLKRFKRQVLAVMGGFRYTVVKPSERSDHDPVADEPTSTPSTTNLIQVQDSEVEAITAMFRPVIERLSGQICNFSGRKETTGQPEGLDYSLMAECTLGVAKLLERFPPTLSEKVKDKMVPDICACMKSKEHKTRLVARNTLKRLMSVKTNFISFGRMLNYLKANLKVGFQKHVLNHAVYSILSSSEKRFTDSPNEVHIQSIIPLCEEEFFGVMDEEKRIGKITEKTAEARTPNAVNILIFCAKISQSPEDVYRMVECGLAQLRLKRSEKNVTQVKKWLGAIQTGLSSNGKIDVKQLLTFLSDMMTKYEQEADALAAAERETNTTEGSKARSTFEIKLLPSKTVRDTLTTEMDLLRLFQYKLLYHFFRNFNQQLLIATDYYLSAVDNLKHQSHEIMLLSHRLVTLFLGWDQNRKTVPRSLLPGGTHFEDFWKVLVLNVVKYCDSSSAEETVNVIFTSVTTFLSVHGEMKLKEQDLTVLLSTLHRFLANGHCVGSAMRFLTSIIEMKLQVHYIENIMEDLLKVGIRSTTPHVIEACQKVYLKYLMVYGSAQKGGMDAFLNSIWMSAKGAQYGHEGRNILNLVGNIIRNIPPSTFGSFFRHLPVLILEMAFSESTDIQALSFSILDDFLGLSGAIGLVCPIVVSLMSRQPQQYEPIVIIYLLKVFNAVSRCPEPNTDFLKQCAGFILKLMENGDQFRAGMKVAYQQVLELIQGYAKDGMCNAKLIRKLKLRGLINFMATNGVDHSSEVVKISSLDLISIFVRQPYMQALALHFHSTQLPTARSPVPFMESTTGLQQLFQSHFNCLEHSETIETKEKAARNLDIFVQLMCHCPEVEAPTTSKEFSTYFVDKIKRLINQEVTQHPEEYTSRDIGYGLLRTYIHLADSVEKSNLNIGNDYERRKTMLPEGVITPSFLNNASRIVRLGVRDSTDGNVKDELKRTVDSLLHLLRNRLGVDVYNSIEAEVREKLHTRRRKNKALKAESAVKYPGKQRKRSGSKLKGVGSQSKKPKQF